MNLIGQLTINGKDAYAEWGMTMDTTSLSALMTPAGMKDNVKSSSRLQHGTRVSRDNPRIAERNLSLTIQFSAQNETEFFDNYLSFCEELETGFLNIITSFQPNVCYKMEYRSCQQFTQFNRGIAKFVLRLTENDPTDRSK